MDFETIAKGLVVISSFTAFVWFLSCALRMVVCVIGAIIEELTKKGK